MLNLACFASYSSFVLWISLFYVLFSELNLQKRSTPDFTIKNVSYGHFLSEELILYYVADTKRSLPSAIDGLKPSQRKVICELLDKFNPGELVRVASLSGRVIERRNYHHGPQSLEDLIVRMTDKRANNINLIGQGGANWNTRKGKKWLFSC